MKTTTDIDGNVYNTVKIGNQIWMAENLKVTRYNDGIKIGRHKWIYPGTRGKYGRLYDFHAVDTGKLAPKGWHVPSDKEWDELIKFLGGPDVAGKKLKEEDFKALMSGYRFYNGNFNYMDTYAYFWSSPETTSYYAWGRLLDYDNSEVTRYFSTKDYGFSVRCIKN